MTEPTEKEIVQNSNFLKIKKLNKKEIKNIRLIYKKNNWVVK